MCHPSRSVANSAAEASTRGQRDAEFHGRRPSSFHIYKMKNVSAILGKTNSPHSCLWICCWLKFPNSLGHTKSFQPSK